MWEVNSVPLKAPDYFLNLGHVIVAFTTACSSDRDNAASILFGEFFRLFAWYAELISQVGIAVNDSNLRILCWRVDFHVLEHLRSDRVCVSKGDSCACFMAQFSRFLRELGPVSWMWFLF